MTWLQNSWIFNKKTISLNLTEKKYSIPETEIVNNFFFQIRFLEKTARATSWVTRCLMLTNSFSNISSFVRRPKEQVSHIAASIQYSAKFTQFQILFTHNIFFYLIFLSQYKLPSYYVFITGSLLRPQPMWNQYIVNRNYYLWWNCILSWIYKGCAIIF